MAKTIVFCADGTWDTADKRTNVYKLYKALLTTSDQVPYYDDGVGADGNPVWKLIGGAFGTGLWLKIKDAYAKIAHVYEAGDRIFLFGFSRGAFTARSLAGMIAICGLPTKNVTPGLVDTAFKAYREKDHRETLLDTLKDSDMDNAKITMVGVWDTVGSLGIPAAFGASDPIVYGFLDTTLHPDVLNACHALAIDEKRAQFPASLWTGSAQPGQTIEQVWFTGVHSDIGGGEPDDLPGTNALSDITLGWMMSKASKLGLEFDTTVLAQYTIPLDPEFALDKLHTSWTIVNGFPRHRSIGRDAVISNSVLIRCVHDQTYRPANLQFNDGVLSNSYGTSAILSEPQLAALVQSAGSI